MDRVYPPVAYPFRNALGDAVGGRAGETLLRTYLYEIAWWDSVSDALRVFEHEMWRVGLLDIVLTYVGENREELMARLKERKKAGQELPVASFQEFQQAVLDVVTIGSLALFWRAFESYCQRIFRTPRCVDIVRQRCPEFSVRCHWDHSDEHVLTVLRDIRNRELHDLSRFNVIKCDREPSKITLQPVFVRGFEDRTEVMLFDEMKPEERLDWRRSMSMGRIRNSHTTLGEFMVEEARECIRRFDALSTATGALRKGKKLPPRKPLVFPAPPASEFDKGVSPASP